MKIDPAIVRRLREQRAWSQEQLADVAGLSVRTVQRIETGGGASLDTRMALASALEVEPADLCHPSDVGEESPAPPVDGEGGLGAALHKYQGLIVGLAIVALLAFGIAYQVGKDLAERENRVECEAKGRTDCR